jgi:hypothetical protein
MAQSIAEQWQTTFWQTLRQHESAERLKEAALQSRLGEWTQAHTAVVVATCEAMD